MIATILAWLTLSIGVARAEVLRFGPADGAVGFEAHATLHDFEGRAGAFDGTLDTSALTGTLAVPVASLTTGIGARDARMRGESLDAARFPQVRFTVDRIEGDTAIVRGQAGSGSVTLVGALTVRDVTRPLRVMATVSREGDGLRLRGRHEVRWDDFGVPDPSVLVARLDPTIFVVFDVLARPTAAPAPAAAPG
jgi:polyisoprenoid-binding protein YceI